mmetsp:Transcript_37699/g.112879  ORF Transcript_37699/g.112879 Transcript_37699/m.112879 type:complete len:251 (+) Transcript_37699:2-754(+)
MFLDAPLGGAAAAALRLPLLPVVVVVVRVRLAERRPYLLRGVLRGIVVVVVLYLYASLDDAHQRPLHVAPASHDPTDVRFPQGAVLRHGAAQEGGEYGRLARQAAVKRIELHVDEVRGLRPRAAAIGGHLVVVVRVVDAEYLPGDVENADCRVVTLETDGRIVVPDDSRHVRKRPYPNLQCEELLSSLLGTREVFGRDMRVFVGRGVRQARRLRERWHGCSPPFLRSSRRSQRRTLARCFFSLGAFVRRE